MSVRPEHGIAIRTGNGTNEMESANAGSGIDTTIGGIHETRSNPNRDASADRNDQR